MLRKIRLGRKFFLISFVWLMLVGVAVAQVQPCVICSVEQSRIHSEECSLSTIWQGQAYYFCEENCQTTFSEQSEVWVKKFALLEEQAQSDESGAFVPS